MRFLAKGMSSKKWCTFGEAWSGDGDEKKEFRKWLGRLDGKRDTDEAHFRKTGEM
jgi:hypothetical protein